MNKIRITRTALASLAALVACGCAHNASEEPRVVVKEVVIPKPVPCKALSELGPEPIYPDSDEALKVAKGIGPLAQLYRMGRLLRNQRLAEYVAARAACEALGG